MTIISNLITRKGIAFASDSLITQINADGSIEYIKWKQSKIIPINKLRAAVNYWGLAQYGSWSTYGWLREKAESASQFSSLEKFAQCLLRDLESQLSKLAFNNPQQAGIGIHLAGYELVHNCWIPELFLCSNYTDPSYSIVGRLCLTRETYHWVTQTKEKPKPEHRNFAYRKVVHDYLINGGILTFHNGDPEMFYQSLHAYYKLIDVLKQRGNLIDIDNIDLLSSIVKRPIEIVSQFQHDFCRPQTRRVGGRIHDLIITNKGEFSSKSGADKLQ